LKIKNPGFYDFKFDVQILSNQEFLFQYKIGEAITSNKYRFGQKIENNDFRFVVNRKAEFSEAHRNLKYFFVINSNEALLAYLASNINVSILNLDANTIKVSFKDHSPRKASDIINMIDSVYLQEPLMRKPKHLNKQSDFLKSLWIPLKRIWKSQKKRWKLLLRSIRLLT
jgi:hypothetical protein